MAQGVEGAGKRRLAAVAAVCGLLLTACTGPSGGADDRASVGTGQGDDGPGAGSDRTVASPSEPEVAAAERLCPVLWDWVKAVGEAFNSAADDVAGIADITSRRDRWEAAFQEIEGLNEGLRENLGPLADEPILELLVAEIDRDLSRAAAELDDIRRLFVDHPDVDRERHQARTSQIIVRMEKVIDLPKPDLRPLDRDGVLVPAFRQVPSCQHAIRDVDDGTPRANG